MRHTPNSGQWGAGEFEREQYRSEVIFPVAFSEYPYIVLPFDTLYGASTRSNAYPLVWNKEPSTNTKARILTDSTFTQGYGWFAIGISV